MERIELAERQYSRIAPKPGATWPQIPLRHISVWLKDYVCPVVEDLVGNPVFQRCTRWSMEQFAGNRITSGAALVAKVDQSLVDAAQAQLAIIADKAVKQAVAAQNPPKKTITRETVEITSNGIRRVSAVEEMVDSLPRQLAQVRRLADHRFASLACGFDFFAPVGSLVPSEELASRRREGISVTEGDLVVSLTPELHSVGDFVTRTMLRRVDVWTDCLRSHRRMLYTTMRAISAGRGKLQRLQEAEETAWSNLSKTTTALRRFCSTGPTARLCDACMTLTQAYASFHPEPDLGWLGLPENIIRHGIDHLKQDIRSGKSLESLDRIAAALPLLRELPAGDDCVEAAIQAGHLVLVRKPAQAFWEQNAVGNVWHKNARPFLLLWKLAEKAMCAGGIVCDGDIWDARGAKNRLSQLKGRLLGLLRNSTLARKISYVNGQGVRLSLDRQKIHLFESRSG